MRQQFKFLLIGVLALAIVGLLQFVVCTGIAMAQFPEGYSFRDNFLSELGIQGFENYAGDRLFNSSTIFLGVSLLPVFGLLWLVDPRQSVSIRITSILGCVSSLGLIGVGFWTYDRYFLLHHLAMAMWLFPMLYMVVAFFYAASNSPHVGIGFLSVSLIMVIAMIYVLLSTDTSTVQLLQKAVVGCGLVWIAFIIAFLWQSGWAVYHDWTEDDGSRARKEQSYLATLGSGHHRRD